MRLLLQTSSRTKLFSSLLTLFILFIPNKNSGQTVQGDIIGIGVSHTIQSAILNEERTIWVHVPETRSDSNEAFPVVYLLDGDSHFTSVVGTIQELSARGNSILPKMIVVGILNTDRLRDLTPKHGNSENGPNTSGGGEAFMDFIQKELISFVDKTYKTKPYRLYIGHSLGGLTVINTMLKRPELFNSYIALDPSLWWSDSVMLEEAKMILNNKNLSNETLFVGIANSMPSGITLATVEQDTSKQTQHIRDILEFTNKVVPHSSSQIKFNSNYYPNESHGSLPLIATYDALRFIFSWYNLNQNIISLIINPNVTASTVIKTLKNHYEIVSYKMNYTILPPESLVNQFGYACLRRKLYDKAEAFFKLNVKNYPNNSNVYDSLGDYYAEVNEKDKAVSMYQKALKTGKGNNYSRNKLNTLLLKEERSH
ncbi:alpha/beta hydrolase-fold protein [Bizionia sp.]|uniref:alpha/beta hydrolase-fold protein n=1 Tax=Bizionia sp. TaxID=1954480 RepID=UPI003A92072D